MSTLEQRLEAEKNRLLKDISNLQKKITSIKKTMEQKISEVEKEITKKRAVIRHLEKSIIAMRLDAIEEKKVVGRLKKNVQDSPDNNMGV